MNPEIPVESVRLFCIQYNGSCVLHTALGQNDGIQFAYPFNSHLYGLIRGNRLVYLYGYMTSWSRWVKALSYVRDPFSKYSLSCQWDMVIPIAGLYGMDSSNYVPIAKRTTLHAATHQDLVRLSTHYIMEINARGKNGGRPIRNPESYLSTKANQVQATAVQELD